VIDSRLHQETLRGLDTLAPYQQFEANIRRHRDELRAQIDTINSQHKTILGYGASTKGNVILQYCGFTENDLPAIAERNPDKYGRFTPGTLIPIIPEADARARRPDYLLALPWHFRNEFIQREKEFLDRGGQILFPLPRIETVGR
jgi:hypothetical protein